MEQLGEIIFSNWANSLGDITAFFFYFFSHGSNFVQWIGSISADLEEFIAFSGDI